MFLILSLSCSYLHYLRRFINGSSFIPQALIFWVVDNFLKKKAFKKPKATVSTTENNGVKYFRNLDKVKYFTGAKKPEDSESDILLSLDEDSEGGGAKYRGAETNMLNRSDSDGGSSHYGLLSPAIT